MALALARRAATILLQVVAVVLIVFFLVRLLPGNPAVAIAGPGANQDRVAKIEQRLGLDQDVAGQFKEYASHLSRGDLGDSIVTGQPVLTDLTQRFGATLLLISLSLLIAGALGLVLAAVIAARPAGLLARVTSAYGFAAGALPDFLVALGLIYVFYFLLGLAPDPSGQIDPTLAPPRETGVALVDSLLAGNAAGVESAAMHLILPVLALVLVYTGPILRLTSTACSEALDQNFIRFARSQGLSQRQIVRYAVRSILPTFVTVMGTTFGFLLGGAVLVEFIFSWGGIGEYAVNAISQSDYAALQGFVIVAGLFTALVYAAVEVAYVFVDPRARAG
jgi:peptide/nickel transport system permease protein